MTLPFILSQASQGWLTTKLLSITLSSAEWVLWILAALSVLSIALMLERLAYFASHRLPNSADLATQLAQGEFEAVKRAIGDRKGMEASVIRDALAAIPQGPDTVEQVIAAAITRERPEY